MPAYTPEAEQRLAAERAERATRGPADSYADLPIWTRCITRGWNGIGSNYSSNTQIFQSPGYVVVLQELIHEPRIIPLDGRDWTAAPTCSSGSACRAATGKATRSWWKRATSTRVRATAGRPRSSC